LFTLTVYRPTKRELSPKQLNEQRRRRSKLLLRLLLKQKKKLLKLLKLPPLKPLPKRAN
jgi:hypothetical protein